MLLNHVQLEVSHVKGRTLGLICFVWAWWFAGFWAHFVIVYLYENIHYLSLPTCQFFCAFQRILISEIVRPCIRA